jgi:hypothetical protein
VPILVKCNHTQVIKNITLCNGYLFILSSRGMGTSYQVAKSNSEGDKCSV